MFHENSNRTPIDKLRAKESLSDEEFDEIFPKEVWSNSNRHYTSVYISQRAAEYLTKQENSKILDIGSGTGKFCLVGAACTNAHYTGVEYRKYQHDIAVQCANDFSVDNVSFIHANIVDIDFELFDGFYIFNPFLENIDTSARIDNLIETKESDYELFKTYVHDQLDKKQIGTRLATYWTSINQIPESYELKKSILGDTLKFWEKVK